MKTMESQHQEHWLHLDISRPTCLERNEAIIQCKLSSV